MDPNISTIIIALLTGFFSVLTVIIQKRQDKVIKRIDEQTMFIEKEKSLKQRLNQKEKEREMIIHEIMILVLDTNLDILKNTKSVEDVLNADVFEISDDLKAKFESTSHDIQEITKEYEMLISMSSEIQEELEKNHKKK
ncbi:MAG: hypothetical protein NC548_12875 [Lachnospiraceae bacterium]|nr:hypothetical protein [Lachnospiraceae bacterium]MCM1230716.1 hypothetical protein [Ruminococcus flavefaciens]